MKKLLTLLAGYLVLTFASVHAATVAAWTFETPNVPGTLVGTTMTGVLPSIGTGTASAFHSDSATLFTSAVGNGSATSWAADHWTVGDYWQFQTSTVGFTGIQLSLAQRAVPSGPTNFSLAFSLDGVNFTTAVVQYGIRSDANLGAWDSGSANAGTVSSFSLSSFTQLNNASAVYFRVLDNVPGSGESRIDDFQVFATAVPEPTTLAILSAAALIGCGGTRLRRRRF